MPASRLVARLEEHPAPDLEDQLGLLEHRHEVVRSDDAAGRMLPAQQRLDAGDMHTREIEHRLVHQEELAVGEHAPQVHLELEPSKDLGLHLGREHSRAVAAVALGPVQRDVGVAQQLAGRGAVAARDADAGRHGQRRVLERGKPERFAQHVVQPFGHELGTGSQRHTLGQHDELVAAETADGVAVADDAVEAGRNRLEELVADLVAHGVVDRLEIVQVDEQRRDRRVLAAGAGQHVLGPVEDQRPVGQTGQGVVQRLVADLVEQTRVAHRGRGMCGEAAQPLGHGRVAAQAVGVLRHDREHVADELTVRHDRHAGGGDRTGVGHDRPDFDAGEGARPVEVRDGLHEVRDRKAAERGSQVDLGLGGVPVGRGEVAGAGRVVDQDHDGPVAVHDGWNGAGEPRRHLVGAGDLGERVGQLQQRVRGARLPAGLLERAGRVERRGGQSRVRLEDAALLWHEGMAVGIERSEPAVRPAFRADLHDEPIGAIGVAVPDLFGDA